MLLVNESAEITKVGATAFGLESDCPEVDAFAITTAKYGSKMAPAKATHMIGPWPTATPTTRQMTRTVIATVYFNIRALRSSSGD